MEGALALSFPSTPDPNFKKASFMRFGTLIKSLSAATAFAVSAAAPAMAESAGPVDSQSWTFTGPLGHYDERQLQRGLYVYQVRCQACHSLGLVRFSALAELGWETEEGVTGADVAKAIASNYEIPYINEDGDADVRPGLLNDTFPWNLENPKRAIATYGKAPPDLSTMNRARIGGADYVYALLTGYDNDHEQPEGAHYNKVIPVISMPNPWPEDMSDFEYPDGTVPTLEQQARDVTAFLNWTADPFLEERHQWGIIVVLYMLALTVLSFIAYRIVAAQVFAKLEQEGGPDPEH